MSLLAEILSSAQKIELEHVETKVPEITSAIDNLKTDVSTYMENVYVKFLERPKQNKLLSKKASELQSEVTELKKCIEDSLRKKMLNTGQNMNVLLKSLGKHNVELEIVSNLCSIHERLLEIRKLQADEAFLESMQKIAEVEELLDSKKCGENLQVLSELSVSVETEKHSLLNRLTNHFKDNVILEDKGDTKTIKIKRDPEFIKDILSAFYEYKSSITCLDNVTSFLWHHCFVPIVDYTTHTNVTEEDNFSIFQILIVDNSKMSYDDVFSNIKNLVDFLCVNFNLMLNEDLSSLGYIGQDLRDNLAELIIKHCLQDTIPSTSEGLQKYDVVIAATEDLETFLKESKIFSDEISILEYANNIDVLFINKKCQDYVGLAQNLMKRDLHDMVEIGVRTESSSFEPSKDFPKSAVSRSVLDLIQLLEKILNQAVSSSEVCAGRLFCTVRNICKMYTIFVPEQHKKLLETIPQQVALFYNNCMYISYKLTEWNGSYLVQLPSMLNLGSNCFTDDGRHLQDGASDKFTDFVKSQINQIEEIMKSSHLDKSQTLEHVEASVEKSLRQSLRQQELLKTVWSKVLPYTVYNKTLGEILNTLCGFLIGAVLSFKDISTEAAESLVELFKMVQTRGPKLFTDSKEVGLFVASWYKMGEVIFVLSASLLDINDRWADGKGPLGLQFKPEELKRLIRALFQNTERRTALLAKIHN